MYQSPYYGMWQMPIDIKKQSIKKIRREANRSAWGVLLIILSMSFLTGIITAIWQITGVYGTAQGEVVEQIGNCLGYALGCFVPFLIMFFIIKKDWDINELIPFQKVKFGLSVWILLLGFSICILSNIPANFLAAALESLGLNGVLPDLGTPDSLPGWIFYSVQIAIIPALVEEFAFRGIILSRLRKFGDGFSVVATAFLFALFHGNVIQFVFTFLVGLYFGFVMIKTNNLWLPIILHSLNNGFSVAVQLVEKYGGLDLANQIYSIVLLGSVLLGILSLLRLILAHKNIFRLAENKIPLRFGAKLGALLVNPGVIALFIYSTYSSVLFLVMDFSMLGY